MDNHLPGATRQPCNPAGLRSITQPISRVGVGRSLNRSSPRVDSPARTAYLLLQLQWQSFQQASPALKSSGLAISPHTGVQPRRVDGPPQETQILVVDDNATNRKILQRQLQHIGYCVDAASNGLEALACCTRQAYAAVMMDCQMPILNGYDTTRRLRQQEGNARHTVIIAVTANTAPGHRDCCLAAGMDDFIYKPANECVLRTVLNRWLHLDA